MADFSGIPSSNPMPTLSGNDAVADGLAVAKWSSRAQSALASIGAILSVETASNDLKSKAAGSIERVAHDARVS